MAPWSGEVALQKEHPWQARLKGALVSRFLLLPRLRISWEWHIRETRNSRKIMLLSVYSQSKNPANANSFTSAWWWEVSQALPPYLRDRETYVYISSTNSSRLDITKCAPFTLETLVYNSMAEWARKSVSETRVWMMVGLVCRVALQMGYHRSVILSGNKIRG